MRSQHASAALTGALLASKGAAAPSNTVSAFLKEFPKSAQPSPNCPSGPPPGIRPEEAVATVVPVTALSEKGGGGTTKARAKLSVRLDQGRHLRLKLAAAHLRRSSQAIMLDALDAYLSTIEPTTDGNCPCLSDDG